MKLISIEGIDGAGKTTQVELLRKSHPEWLYTYNPGDTTLGKNLRQILLNSSSDLQISSMAELMIYMADRAEHFEQIISPALESGDRIVIICDRFTDSTVAYQGYGRGIDLDVIDRLNLISTQNRKADLTILLDLDVEESLKRKKSRDRMESIGLEFQQRVRKGFLEIAKTDPARVKIVPVSDKQPMQIHQEIINIMQQEKILL